MCVLLLSGITVAGIGLYSLSWGEISAPSWVALRPYAVVMILGGLACEAGAQWLRIHRVAAGCLVAAAGSLLFGAVWPLLAAAWFAFASYVLGRRILALLGADVEGAGAVVSCLVGAALYGTMVELLAHIPVNYPGVYAVGLALPLVLWRRTAMDAFRAAFRASMRRSTSGGVCTVLMVAVALAHLTVALMPEVGHDALATHLFVPTQLAARHAWGFDVTTYSWAVMPMMGDWLFSIGYMLAGEQGARLVNVFFILANTWLVLDLTRWAGGSERGARWGALLFLTTPLVLLESSSLYVESIWAAFIVSGSLSLLRALDSSVDRSTHAPAAGVLLGAGLAAKAVSLTILPVLFIVFVAGYASWMRRPAIKPLLLGLLAFLLIGGIPYAAAWLLTANPLFPYFNEVFRSPLWPSLNFEDSRWSKGLQWDAIYQLTFNSGKFLEGWPGATGFQWVLLFVPGLFLLAWSRRVRPLILVFIGVCSIALTFHSIAYLRYVFPAFVWVTAALAVVVAPEEKDAGPVQFCVGLTACVVVALNLLFFKSATHYGEISLKPLLSKTERSAYLAERLPIRTAVAFLNQLNVNGAPVAFFSSPLAGELTSDALFSSWYNPKFESEINAVKSIDGLGLVLAGRQVDYVVLDAAWGTPELRSLIAGATEPIIEFGDVSVRKARDIYRFSKELLQNPGFLSGDGWAFAPSSQRGASGRVQVSVSTPITQHVAVVPGRRYRNSVTANCDGHPSEGRVQVNWLDRDARIISASIRVFECGADAKTHVMDVVAPEKAVAADVYATGHSEQPITVTNVSFKE